MRISLGLIKESFNLFWALKLLNIKILVVIISYYRVKIFYKPIFKKYSILRLRDVFRLKTSFSIHFVKKYKKLVNKRHYYRYIFLKIIKWINTNHKNTELKEKLKMFWIEFWNIYFCGWCLNGIVWRGGSYYISKNKHSYCP